MSRFDFLEQDFPELYQLCNDAEKYQNTDSGIALLKARQALEYIVRQTTDYEIEDLFTGICELNDEGIIDSAQCSQFHCVRRIANEGVHEKNVSQDDIEECIDALFDVVNWYVTHEKSCSKKFMPQEVSVDEEDSDNLNSSTYKNEINPLETSGNIDFNNTGETENELKKDVFETDEEYVTRIAARAPIQIGYGILDPKNVDEYTKIIFLTFHINKIEGTCFVPINAFYAVLSQPIDKICDGTIWAKLKIGNGRVCYDYDQTFLRVENQQDIKLNVICWNKFGYENQEMFEERINNLQVLPLGICKPIKKRYDIKTHNLPFTVSIYKYMSEIFSKAEMDYSLDRDTAKKLCMSNEPTFLYGNVDCQLKVYNQFILHKDCINSEDRYKGEVGKIRKLVEQGDASAQNNLGYAYEHGEGVTQNYEEAVRWYRKAAEQGNVDAQNKLGYAYKHGVGVTQDFEEAVKWYRKAADQENADAQNNLGHAYENGEGVTQNYEEAVRWYRKSAERGNATAQILLGWAYSIGRGVTTDSKESMKWYCKAAEQGDDCAQFYLHYAYAKGKRITQYNEEVVKWCCKTIEQRHASAQFSLGYAYDNGEGVTQDHEEAVKWYRKAAEQGHASAQFSLGYAYENGKGVTQNNEEAVKWYRKAAEQGHASAKKALKRLNHDSGCFITTAVCACLGKADNCYELRQFRMFRDGWLVNQIDGKALIDEYYRIAPAIVAAIDMLPFAEKIYFSIWQKYLLPCLRDIECNHYVSCKQRYVNMVRDLEKRYGK